MVGSYEESILRGRMSTTPSKPLNFVAQIGVLGIGKCKPSLRCPEHVTLPFPAVFYSYGANSSPRDSGREEGPSPYVGLIDLESSLPHSEDGHDEKRRKRYSSQIDLGPEDLSMSLDSPENHDTPSSIHTTPESERRLREKRRRRSTSPKSPPGGSYRIPPKGQLQIIIKNPNKTAVKLFLVPYDLQDMEPGTKTFIRQRSYSAGPIIDSPITSSQPTDVDLATPLPTASVDAKDRPTLRYLIHIHICCPSKGRYYLYKGIRVVFANRVPDGKENLRNEIQLPEPRYSVYKPSRDSGAHTHAATLASDKAFRRRSAGLGYGAGLRMDGVDFGAKLGGGDFGRSIPAVPAIPFGLAGLANLSRPRRTSDMSAGNPFALSGLMDIDRSPPLANISRRGQEPNTEPRSPTSPVGRPFPPLSSLSFAPIAERPGSSSSWRTNSSGSGSGGYDKLKKGDVGYGGPAGVEEGEGLLARKLRGLEVMRRREGE